MDVEALLSRLDMLRDALTLVLILIIILIVFILPLMRYFTKKPEKEEAFMEAMPGQTSKSPITGRSQTSWSSRVLKKKY